MTSVLRHEVSRNMNLVQNSMHILKCVGIKMFQEPSQSPTKSFRG